ncbi:MAG: class I SAM-dependent methyltransferase [Gammaproteobacteria bacterium]|nr:class I SAM-dependent methyltransferase [Gammaproteobacteria bacterium]
MTNTVSAAVAVIATEPQLQIQARQLAERLQLPVAMVDGAEYPLLLVQTAERLELRQTGPLAPGPVYVDFIGGSVGHRFHFGGGRGQLIAKAVGIKKGFIPTVIDATGGLGRDSFVLASLGCTVTLVERSPIIAELLRDGMARAELDNEIGAIVRERMHLVMTDAIAYLVTLSEAQRPDVVYLDPMYPERRKSAAVKKEMRAFQLLLGGDEDEADLLVVALRCACKRVVVKRPRQAESIAGPKPSLSMSGQSTRFDIYFTVKT